MQDNVPAFESAQAVAIVERNLGGPIGTYFDSFDMTPIAAASLGQVPVSATPRRPPWLMRPLSASTCAHLEQSSIYD